MYIIGIDIGTSSTKAVAMQNDGTVICSTQIAYPTFNSIPGVSEQDPELVWAAFVDCVRKIVTDVGSLPEAIALSSAMHSLICLDENGIPISRLITWADNRSAAIASRLKDSAEGIALYTETGTPIHAMSPLCKLLWFKENEPDVFQRSARFVSIKELCWFRIFGVFEVDYSIASATGLFNISTCEWHHKALELAGIDTSRLSHPVNTDFLRRACNAIVAEKMGITGETPFVIGGSDGCMANVGSFATEPGIAALTIGTSGAIRVAGTTPTIDIRNMPFNYRLDEKTFISGGPVNNGGIALKWYAESLLKRSLKNSDDYESLLSCLEVTPPGSDGLVFLPYLFGERAPIWNSDSCGVFFGITAQHKQEHFTRAVIEGITFSLFQIAKALEEGGLDIQEIHVSGGFVRSSRWVQLLANIFGKRVCLTNVADASAIGAAMIALKALKIKHQLKQESTVIYQPEGKEHDLYRQKYFPMYEHLYRTLILEMKIFHENKTAVTI